jgi:hypothetical protein
MVENFKISETNYCGNCPECNSDWDMGEVIDVVRDGLLNHDYYKNNPDKLEKIEEIAKYNARVDYGWTPENRVHISKLVTIEPSDSQQCPNCSIAWDAVTGDRTDRYKLLIAESEVMKKAIDKMHADIEARLSNS